MGATDPGSARDEAERLVAAALAMARSAASGAQNRAEAFGPLGQMISDALDQVRGPGPAEPAPAGPAGSAPADAAEPAPAGPAGSGPAGSGPTGPAAPGPAEPGPAEADPTAGRAGGGAPLGTGFATGGPECCVCPVCRAIAALRDPSPDLAERLATGAGDFAAGVASLLRAFSAAAGSGARESPSGAGSAGAGGAGGSAGRSGAAPAPPSGPSRPDDDEVWREATRTGHDSRPAHEPDVWAAATRADTTPPGTGRPPVPASRAPEEPVATGPGAADEDAPADGA